MTVKIAYTGKRSKPDTRNGCPERDSDSFMHNLTCKPLTLLLTEGHNDLSKLFRW